MCALFLPGPAVAEISGSVGGTTFARNRFGAYMRNRTIPVNPNSSHQQAVRNAVAQLAARWSQVLTSDQRSEWNSYGANVTVQNALGQDVNLTGFQQYIRSNSVRTARGDPIEDDGPAVLALPEVDPTILFSVVAATGVVTTTFDNGYDWADTDDGFLYVFQGVPQNGGVNFFNGPWRYMGTIEGDTAVPPTSPDASLTVPFACQTAQNVWFYCRQSNADGRLTNRIIRGPITPS